MPIIKVRTSAAVSDVDLAAITRNLVESTCRTLRKDRGLVVVNFLTGGESGSWFVAGQGTQTNGVLVEMSITVTAGTNTLEEKSAWVRESFEAIVQTLGRPLSPCYIAVHEVPDQAWGFDGLTQLGRNKLASE